MKELHRYQSSIILTECVELPGSMVGLKPPASVLVQSPEQLRQGDWPSDRLYAISHKVVWSRGMTYEVLVESYNQRRSLPELWQTR
jgi:hypothetical protein